MNRKPIPVNNTPENSVIEWDAMTAFDEAESTLGDRLFEHAFTVARDSESRDENGRVLITPQHVTEAFGRMVPQPPAFTGTMTGNVSASIGDTVNFPVKVSQTAHDMLLSEICSSRDSCQPGSNEWRRMNNLLNLVRETLEQEGRGRLRDSENAW